MKKLLLCMAHPDDESFFVGGTVATYVKDGWDVTLAVATKGQMGVTGGAPMEPEILGAARQAETEKAAQILGIKTIKWLDQKDSRLKECTPGTLEDPLHDIMLELLPDVVITFDTLGCDNHPDHIKMSYATTYAFQKYAAHLHNLKNLEFKGRGRAFYHAEYERSFGESHAVSDEPKLYYVSMPKSVCSFMKKEKQMENEAHGKPLVGSDDKKITTVIDIEAINLEKGKALLCHETQMEKVDAFISFPANPWVKQEYFILRMQGIYEVIMGKNDHITSEL